MMMRKMFLVALTAGLGILWAAEPVNAQSRGGRRGGVSWNGGGVSWGRGGISIGVGQPYSGFYGPGYGSTWGSNYYGSPYGYGSAYPYSYSTPYSSAYSRSYRPSYMGSYSYPSGTYYSYPSSTQYYSYPSSTEYYSSPGQVITSGSTMPSEGFASTYQPSTTQSFYSGPTTAADRAQLRVMLPSTDAKLWIDGTPTQQSGADRFFTTPSLSSGLYSYSLKATWTENGREVTRQKKVDFQPGQTVFVDMRLADTEQLLNQPNQRPAAEQPSGTFKQGESFNTNRDTNRSDSNNQGQPDHQLDRQRNPNQEPKQNQNPDRP